MCCARALDREAQGETSRRQKVRLPAWAADRRPDRFTLLVAAAARGGRGSRVGRGSRALAGGRLRTETGWDAVNYITVARSLLAGDGLVGLGGGPLTAWPPLYPALLAGGGAVRVRPLRRRRAAQRRLLRADRSGRGLVAAPPAAAFTLPVAVGLLLDRACPSARRRGVPALSESAFILFVTLALTQIDAHLGGGGRASLMRAGGVQRGGLPDPLHGRFRDRGGWSRCCSQRGLRRREKVKRIAVYTLLAAAPLGLWMLRNFLLVGSMTGPRGRGFLLLALHRGRGFAHRHRGLVARRLDRPGPVGARGGRPAHALHRRSQRKSGAPVAAQVARGPLRVCGGFALAYLTLLVAALMLGAVHSGLEWRYLAPAYVPLLLAALLLLDGALRYARKTLAAVLLLALPLQAAWLVVLHKREIRLWNAGARTSVCRAAVEEFGKLAVHSRDGSDRRNPEQCHVRHGFAR